MKKLISALFRFEGGEEFGFITVIFYATEALVLWGNTAKRQQKRHALTTTHRGRTTKHTWPCATHAARLVEQSLPKAKIKAKP